MGPTITIRVIANEQQRSEFFRRAESFSQRNHLRLKILQDEPYWKFEDLFEIEVEFEPAPVWNYGNWSAAFHFLFDERFMIEWEQKDDISLCHYPAYDDFDSCFVIFCIPSNCFIPKPSKTIRH